jgi:hypothetical protein
MRSESYRYKNTFVIKQVIHETHKNDFRLTFSKNYKGLKGYKKKIIVQYFYFILFLFYFRIN